ncbi:MAG: SDR family oxidoreductase [Lewinellaceae bacterium]|nr:SDR family oxidoreductase [Lewinellaceae bacterium]
MSKNLFDLKGKVAVITGGGGVLGGSMARSLGASGVKACLIGRSRGPLEEVAESIRAVGGEALALPADVLDRGAMEKVKEKVLSAWGRIDILVNAAGGNMPGATIGPEQSIFDMKMDDFDRVTRLNLHGSVVPSLVFGQVMAEQKSGVIINISSMAVDRAITRIAGYSASKAAIENFTRWMAVEVALKFGEGIRVNAIAPGFFIGNQNRALLTNPDGTYTERGKTIINNTPMRRFGEAEELNGALHFLCSDAARFVTGIVIPVDGGFSAFSGV